MKKILKDLIPAFVLTFSFCFMLFIYEPIVLYINNISDFWFDIFIMMKYSFIVFIIFTLMIVFIYSIIYFIEKKFIKSKNLYNILILIGFAMLFILYIEGNFLAGGLPALDGSPINWNGFITQKIISFIIISSIIIGIVLLVKKCKYEKAIDILKKISYVIVIMLTVSLVTASLTGKNVFEKKKYMTTATSNNINVYSNDTNLIILLLDSIDSETMENIIQKNKEYISVFDDFTYYPDTVGAYAFTRDNVPLILGGKWSENKESFQKFYNNAMDESILFNNLEERKYNINVYYSDSMYNTERAKRIANLDFDSKVSLFKFMKQELKYDLFKYLPFTLKRFSKVWEMDFNSTRKENEEERFKWDNINFVNNHLKEKVIKTDDKEFKYIHLEGAHYPFNCDKDFNKKENGTYEDKIEASINLINQYLNYLKENNIYDNSMIVILSDHGFWWDIDDESLLKRQNPVLYIKGKDEHHKRNISDEKVSFDNLQDIYKNLIDGEKTDTLFTNIDTSKPRRFLLQRVSDYDHMIEYFQYGKSKDLKTLKKTDKVYALN